MDQSRLSSNKLGCTEHYVNSILLIICLYILLLFSVVLISSVDQFDAQCCGDAFDSVTNSTSEMSRVDDDEVGDDFRLGPGQSFLNCFKAIVFFVISLSSFTLSNLDIAFYYLFCIQIPE